MFKFVKKIILSRTYDKVVDSVVNLYGTMFNNVGTVVKDKAIKSNVITLLNNNEEAITKLVSAFTALSTEDNKAILVELSNSFKKALATNEQQLMKDVENVSNLVEEFKEEIAEDK